MLVNFSIPTLIWSPSNPCFICQHPWFLLRIIFPPSATVCCRAHGVWMRGGGVAWVTKNLSRICAQNYAGAQFNLPTQGPMLGPSPAPGPAEDWEVELCRSCVNTILRPRLRFDRLSSLSRAKWARTFLLINTIQCVLIYTTKCSKHGVFQLKYGKQCFECNNMPTDYAKGKLYTKKWVALIEIFINKRHKKYYIPDIEKLDFNLTYFQIHRKIIPRNKKGSVLPLQQVVLKVRK